MNEPLRLHEESHSDLERALLRAGTSYRSSGRTRAKTLAALGLAGSAVISAGAASLWLSSLVARLGGSKLIGVTSLVGVAAAVPVAYYVWSGAEVPPPAVTARAPEVALAPVGPARNAISETEESPPAQTGTSAPVLEPSGVTTAELPQRASAPPVPKSEPRAVAANRAEPKAANRAEPKTANRAEPKAATPNRVEPKAATPNRVEPKAATPSADLKAELEALDAARASLASGDVASALSRLDMYAREYPRGRLSLEAEVLRIDALAKNGQGEAAKRRAEAFLRRHPNSVLASRVRGYFD